MHIHEPAVREEGDWITVFARVESETKISGTPSELFYSVPGRFADALHAGYEPFVVGLIQIAMGLAEDIHIDGPLSPRLYFNLERYQSIFHHWYPRTFHPIRIRCGGLAEASAEPGSWSAAMFSGGVDSLFTLRTELERRDPVRPGRLTHGIFTYYDQPPRPIEFSFDRYQRKAAQFQALFDSLGLELIQARTNLRQFVIGAGPRERIRWHDLSYGAGMAGLALALSGRLRWIFTPSGMPVTHALPDGSKLIVNHMLSTERLEVVHHGLVESRGDKIAAIGDWAPARAELNVCWWMVYGEKNCGRCPKCVRTIAYLEALDLLQDFPVFDRINRWDRLKWFTSIGESIFTVEIYRLAVQRRKYALALAAGFGLAVARLKRPVRNALRRLRPGFRSDGL